MGLHLPGGVAPHAPSAQALVVRETCSGHALHRGAVQGGVAEVAAAVPSYDAARWDALGSCRVGEHFTAGDVITAAAPVELELADSVQGVFARV